ncbi:MAG: T9SS type A sorting domain-containing protein [Calditrichaeota bacterium]|nr:T9SS type A sorting domain-containing protein [Calditrichota bacterium]
MFSKNPRLLLIVLIYSFLISWLSASSDFRYSEVKIYLDNPAQFSQLAKQGLIFDHIKILEKNEPRLTFKTVVNNLELQILRESGVTFEVTIPDVVEAYKLRTAAQPAISSVLSEDTPPGFELGSMGGFYTFDEVVSELDSMYLNYPNLITQKQSVGKSVEGRDLWTVKISANPQSDENEPEVFYTALHHAREPAGMMNLLYFMDYLLANYGTDPEVTFLLDHRELYFLPVVNPDGYVYNEQTNPDGGGQWRKNRRPVNGSWYGVDLNRNYGYKWGYDDVGSSPYPFSDTYRGDAPFSEPETQAVRDFVNGRHFILTLNYHTYSNLLIYPWGYINALTPDSLIYMHYANGLTLENRYTFGNGEETVNYATNGDSDDWMYGEQSEKPKILAFTPEVGDDSDGFWPNQDRIVPLCKENLRANLNFAWFAGGRLETQNYFISNDDDHNGYPDPGESLSLICNVQNIGQGAAQNVTLSLQSDDPYLQIQNSGSSYSYPQIASQITITDTFSVSVSSDAPDGHESVIILNIEQDGFTRRDTLNGFVIGTPVVAFQDNAEDGIGNWDTGEGWAVASDQNSENHLFTDSPSGKYSNNADNALTLKNPVLLPQSDAIFLTYRTHWDIERPFDFATVEVSTDLVSWDVLKASAMLSGSGSGKQSKDVPGYDGFRQNWLTEWIDITSYQSAGEIYLRFRLQSDGGTRKDGWYLDDIQILAYNTEPSLAEDYSESLPAAPKLFRNFPNPFNSATRIQFFLPKTSHARLALFDIGGKKVMELFDGLLKAGKHSFTLNARSLSSGVYFYRLKTEQVSLTKKLILLK